MIVLNNHAEVIEVEDTNGNVSRKLFGKLGFQTMGENTDKNILANMADLEAALDAGELEDLDGNKVTNNAVITLHCLVTKVVGAADRPHVSRFRNATGTYATVPEASPEDEVPF